MHVSKQAALWTCALLLGEATAVVAQTPTFSLWVTEVNGAPCPSCPTRLLPESEVQPGDVIRVDAFVEDWDDIVEVGVCTGSPNHGFGSACDINLPGGCNGMHCAGSTGLPCQSATQCFFVPACVASACVVAPQVAAFQWTLDSTSLFSGERGSLSLTAIPCDPADCEVVTAGACPCAQFHQLISECTCAFNHSCQSDGVCGPAAAAFIEPLRADFLFYNQSGFLNVAASAVDTTFVGALTGFDASVIDEGRRYYLGTLLLTPSLDAAGAFTVTMINDTHRTFLNDRNPFTLSPQTILPAVIQIPRCAFISCDDFDECTLDTMDPMTCVCGHAPVACPIGLRCEDGDCVPAPVCPRVLASEPSNCTVDARRPHPPDDAQQIELRDRIRLTFDSVCETSRLRYVDFVVEASGAPLGAAPQITSVVAAGSDVELWLETPLPVGQWWCVRYAFSDEVVCTAVLPGDVTNNQFVDSSDVWALTHWLGRMPGGLPPETLTDLDRSGTTGVEDLQALLDLLNGAGAFEEWNGAGYAEKCPSR